jgi:hypothetical protein
MTRPLSPPLSAVLVTEAPSADEAGHVSRWLRLVRFKLRRGSGAVTLARTLSESARSTELRARAREALAWAAIGAGDLALANEASSPLSSNLVDPHDSASDVLSEDELSRIKQALATPARRAFDGPTKP